MFIRSLATLMRTVSLRWLWAWRDQGRAPQRWSKRWVCLFSCNRGSVRFFHLVGVLCSYGIFVTHASWYAVSSILISSVAVWPDHSHLPTATVKEAEGQTCPLVPGATSLRRLLLPYAPRSTGQASTLCFLFIQWFSFVLFTVCLFLVLWLLLMFPMNPDVICVYVLFHPLLDEGRPSLQWGRGCCHHGLFGFALGLHWRLPVGVGHTLCTPGWQRPPRRI